MLGQLTAKCHSVRSLLAHVNDGLHATVTCYCNACLTGTRYVGLALMGNPPSCRSTNSSEDIVSLWGRVRGRGNSLLATTILSRSHLKVTAGCSPKVLATYCLREAGGRPITTPERLAREWHVAHV
jgi:hypothetical protein